MVGLVDQASVSAVAENVAVAGLELESVLVHSGLSPKYEKRGGLLDGTGLPQGTGCMDMTLGKAI